MKKQLLHISALCAVYFLQSFDNTPLAQVISIKLFDATATFEAWPGSTAAEAIPVVSTSIILNFELDDSAIIASTADGKGPIVIDNFKWL